MKCFFFGSKSLTWKHLPVMRALALYSSLNLFQDPNGCGGVPPLSLELMPFLLSGGDVEWPRLSESESLLLIHEDTMPSDKVPGAIGASKLAEVACMEAWPAHRVLRRLRPDPADPDPVAAARLKLVRLKPDRVYCLHTDLDSSKDSRDVADLLRQAKIPFHYVRVSAAGTVLDVQER